MAENLLWPTKLSMPPQLLIDPEVLFNSQDFEYYPRKYLPLISPVGPAKVRYIGLVPYGFMIGFVWNVHQERIDTCRTVLPLPFQDLTVEILQYKLHGWSSKNVDILSTPGKTEWKTKLNVSASATQMYGNPPSSAPSRKPLFKMVGNNLEDNGSKPQFSSSIKYGQYSAILYQVPYETFYENLQSEFPDMFNDYDPSTSTLAIETVVKVGVISYPETDGFKIGVVSS